MNYWYAVELSENIANRPKLLKILDREIVLYRSDDRRIQAMANACLHRGASLALGSVAGDCIVCPYHGWHYEPDGSCSQVPSLATEVPLPKAKIAIYPVVDRDGWIWVFLGDAATAGSPPTIPAELFPFADRDFRRISGKFFWNANYERVLENALDFAHAPFVHAGAFGNPDEPEVPKLEIEEYECGASAMAILKPNPPRGLWKFLASKKVIGIETKTGFIFPNLTFLQVTLPFGKLIIWSAHIPIDSDNTTTKWMNFRSFFTGKWADRDANDRTMAIFQQDRPIVESQRPQIIPDRLDAELHVPADALQLKYRQWRKKAEAN